MRKKLSSSIDTKKNTINLRNKSKKAEPVVVNPLLKSTNQKNNSRYGNSKNTQNETTNKNNNLRNSSSKQIKTNSSTHLVITSVDVNYSKLVEEDQKKLDEIKEKLVRQKQLLEEQLTFLVANTASKEQVYKLERTMKLED